jgi:hypothetical protein
MAQFRPDPRRRGKKGLDPNGSPTKRRTRRPSLSGIANALTLPPADQTPSLALVELWAEGAQHRLATLRREPPVIGERIDHAGAVWRVVRIEPAKPRAFRPTRAIVEIVTTTTRT